MPGTLQHTASHSGTNTETDEANCISQLKSDAPLSDKEGGDVATLVYLSPVPFSSFTQRPHAFVDYFRSRGVQNVIWIDPYPTRLPQLADLRRLLKSTETGAQHQAGIHVVKLGALPFEPLPVVRIINEPLFERKIKQIMALAGNSRRLALVIGKPSLFALRLLSANSWSYSVYDAMDHFPLFYRGISRKNMANVERAICDSVDSVIAGSRDIAESLGHWQAEVVLNAYEPEALPRRDPRQPATNPVFGYVGTIAHWFDWPLVVRMAQSMPEATFRIIGPVTVKPPKGLPRNIELTGVKPHREAMQHAAAFDVGLIPFKILPLTSGVDPVKYYEYRALGLPVISTAFGEMAHRGREPGVFLVGTDLLDSLTRALADTINANASDVQAWNTRFDASRTLATLSARLEA